MIAAPPAAPASVPFPSLRDGDLRRLCGLIRHTRRRREYTEADALAVAASVGLVRDALARRRDPSVTLDDGTTVVVDGDGDGLWWLPPADHPTSVLGDTAANIRRRFLRDALAAHARRRGEGGAP